MTRIKYIIAIGALLLTGSVAAFARDGGSPTPAASQVPIEGATLDTQKIKAEAIQSGPTHQEPATAAVVTPTPAEPVPTSEDPEATTPAATPDPQPEATPTPPPQHPGPTNTITHCIDDEGNNVDCP